MIFNVTIDRDEDGIWIVECPSIPGCVSQGKTRDEALENIKDAIKVCLEVRAEKVCRLRLKPVKSRLRRNGASSHFKRKRSYKSF